MCKYILHNPTISNSLYTHTCIFPQYLILPILFQTLTFLHQIWQQRTAKQTSKKPDDPISKLNQQWKKHGVVIMDSTFLPMSQEMFNYLCKEAEDLDDPIFIDPNVGESQRVNQKLYVDPAVEKNSVAKKLLLGSGDNDMATAIDWHVQNVLG